LELPQFVRVTRPFTVKCSECVPCPV
jgi:hypothetical protein